jgi:hypothetical protein
MPIGVGTAERQLDACTTAKEAATGAAAEEEQGSGKRRRSEPLPLARERLGRWVQSSTFTSHDKKHRPPTHLFARWTLDVLLLYPGFAGLPPRPELLRRRVEPRRRERTVPDQTPESLGHEAGTRSARDSESLVPIQRDPRVRGCSNPRIGESTDPQIHRSTDPQIHRSTNLRIHRSTDPQARRSTDPQIHRVTTAQSCGSTELRLLVVTYPE